ncbi:unnamed protein product [Caenorhabditis brenneri]
MLLTLLILFFVMVGSTEPKIHYSYSVNGTILCDDNDHMWSYTLQVVEFDTLKNDVLGETSHHVTNRDRSTFHMQLRDLDWDGFIDNHFELGYEIKAWCNRKKFNTRFYSSVVHFRKTVFHEEVSFNLNTHDFKVVGTCEEYSCLPR